MATARTHANDSRKKSKVCEPNPLKQPNNYCDPCKFDDALEIARGFCIACCEYLCKCCCREHNKHKATRDHAVLADQEFPEDISPFLAIKKLMRCSIHTDEEVTHECADHNCLICVTCITESHRQCGEVKKLGSKNSKDTNGSNLKKISSLQMKTMNYKLRSECAILCYLAEKETTDIEDREFKSKIIKQMEKIIADLQKKLWVSSDYELSKISEAASNCKLIENELNDLQNMANIMAEHGSKAERAIVSKHVGKKVDDVVSKMEQIHFRVEKPIGFHEHMLENSSDDVLNGHVLGKSDKNKMCSNTVKAFQGTMIVKVRDNFQQKEQIKKEKLQRPYIMREIGTKNTHYILSPTDEYQCDIVAMNFVGDDMLLLADHSNRKLKLFDRQFCCIDEIILPDCPTDMCTNSRGIFVCFSSLRFIHRYNIDYKVIIRESAKFATHYQAVSLDSFDDERILVMFMQQSSFDDPVIQVRAGSTIDVSFSFPDEAQFGHVEKAKRICTISKSAFLLAEDQRVSMYVLDTDDEVLHGRAWFYRSHVRTCLQKATGMFVDSEENVYVCGEESNNVHQVSSYDYRSNRVLISNIHRPAAILVDERGDRLIVACREDGRVHVFAFE
ncbi:uncharacterized protein LOC128244620 [Mya arenaria]|uniref:uncharacterized protein LOC128244620 n=1 Tax=Mya arenaria TaxID=6604 RepID=UPI0022E5CC37|nr:uncharacterized protein LOC128244620 [Mya arenaria]XP_052818594.1 uncharacterized protein LOC128244620 [Mya arenaria]